MLSLARTSKLYPEGAAYVSSAARLLHASCERHQQQRVRHIPQLLLGHQLGDNTPVLLGRAQGTCGDIDSDCNAAVAHLLQLLQGSLLRLDGD